MAGARKSHGAGCSIELPKAKKFSILGAYAIRAYSGVFEQSLIEGYAKQSQGIAARLSRAVGAVEAEQSLNLSNDKRKGAIEAARKMSLSAISGRAWWIPAPH